MRRLLPLLICLAAVPAHAQDLINADRPGIADSSTVVGPHVFQIEFGLQREHDDGARVMTTPLLLRYGVGSRAELRLEGDGYTRGGGTSGFAPLSIGAKVRIADAPSLAVIARLFVPSGSGDLRTHTTTGDLRLSADINMGDRWAVNPNVGVASVDDGGRFTAAIAALTLQYNLSERANVFVDGGFQAPESRGAGSSLLLDAGTAWIVGRDTQLDVSAGWGARGATTPNVFVAAGISRRF